MNHVLQIIHWYKFYIVYCAICGDENSIVIVIYEIANKGCFIEDIIEFYT